MEINPTPQQASIKYNGQSITFNEQTYHSCICIEPSHTVHQLDKTDRFTHLRHLLGENSYDLVLWAENNISISHRTELTNLCWSHHIGVDIDNINAACETFKILQQEHRRVLTCIYF